MFVHMVYTYRMYKAPCTIMAPLVSFPSRFQRHQINKSFMCRYLLRPNNTYLSMERGMSSGKPPTVQNQPSATKPLQQQNQPPGPSSPKSTPLASTNAAAFTPTTKPAAKIAQQDKLELQKDRSNLVPSQLTKIESSNKLPKLPNLPAGLSKKLGWMLSGTATAILTALYGKIYLLFGAIPLVLYHSKDIDVMTKTFNRDTKFLWRHSKSWFLEKRIKNENLTLPKIFQQTEKRHPDKLMLQMHDQSWKFKDIASYANRTSRLMQKYGFQKGDVVAMMALNSPEVVAIMVGMANIGIITALISTELRNEGLTTAIKNSGCKGIIFDDTLFHAFGDVYKNFPGVKIFQMRHKAIKPEFHVLEEELLKEYNDVPEVYINVHHDDPLMYMYHPDDFVFREPIVITHAKFLFDSIGVAMMLDLKPWEQIYTPTPMHESSGMVMGIGPSITNGITTILRPKFSATEYFRECYVHHCTVGQYSGKMCKQLLLSPVSPIETFHPVRAMYGTGLESDYWQEFVDRFGTKMYEVHDTSQENYNLINMEGKVGVIGFRPKLLPSFMFPHYVIKVFGKDNIPIRGQNGLCQPCEYGEPGLLIKLWTTSDPLPPKVKTLQNIFKHGDMAISNGEILTIDEQLYLRPPKKHTDKSWMKKLITSEEIEYIATKLTSKHCAAYTLENVQLQNVEILSIEDPNKTIDMRKFSEDLVDHVPVNWVPHYVRILSKFPLLPDKKIDKHSLVKQGLNMEGDLVYYFNKNSLTYHPFVWAKNSGENILNTPVQATPVTQTKITNAATPPIAPRIKPEPVPAKASDPYLQVEIIVEKCQAAQKAGNKENPIPTQAGSLTSGILDSFLKDKPDNIVNTATLAIKRTESVKQAGIKKPDLIPLPPLHSLAEKTMAGTSTLAIKRTDVLRPEVKTEIEKTNNSVTSAAKITPSSPIRPTPTVEKKSDKEASEPIPRHVFLRPSANTNEKKSDTVVGTSQVHETAAVVKEKKVEDMVSKKTSPSDKTKSDKMIEPAKKESENIDLVDLISRKMKLYAEPVMNKLMKDRLNAAEREEPKPKPKLALKTDIVPDDPKEKIVKLNMSAVQSKVKSTAKAINEQPKKINILHPAKGEMIIKTEKLPVGNVQDASQSEKKIDLKADKKSQKGVDNEQKADIGFGAAQVNLEDKENPKK